MSLFSSIKGDDLCRIFPAVCLERCGPGFCVAHRANPLPMPPMDNGLLAGSLAIQGARGRLGGLLN